MKKKSVAILAVLLPLQIVAVRILSRYPDFVEQWYSKIIYPEISGNLRRGLSWIPFSLGDLLYTFLGILVIRWLFHRIQQGFKHPGRWITHAMAGLSVLYACFNLFWGLNYYRPPLHQTLEIAHDYNTQELLALTRQLVEQSNSLQVEITGDDSTKVVVPYSKSQLLDLALEGFTHLQKDFPQLQYKHPSLKRSLYSIPLTYMGFNGYLNPFTNEGQVNTQIVPYRIPTTASHEIGHQLGFAAENEANFIACLATMNHPDVYFRYSGYTFALSYSLSELGRRDPELAAEVLGTIHEGVLENYREVQQFWEAHKNPFEPVFMFTYNSYLKANNQADGMKSYSYVVALLVNYLQQEAAALRFNLNTGNDEMQIPEAI